MDNLTLCFALLMPLILCFGSTANNETCGGNVSQSDIEVTLVKTIRRQTDVTPLCFNDTLNVVILIVCQISTKRRGEKCFLSYRVGPGFENKCDSRFTLMTENQTFSLQLNSLTPEDGGNYTCECSCFHGTDIIHLNVTVEEAKGVSSYPPIPVISLTVVSAVVIITGIILGFIYRRMRHRKPREPQSTLQIMEPHDIEPYSTFIQKDVGLYSVVHLHGCNSNTNNSKTFTREEKHAGKLL